MSPRSKDFVTISNEQVYSELTAFRIENDRKHDEIIALIAEIKSINNSEHERMKGQIGVLTATIGGVSLLATLAIGWILSKI
jgi:hypothetical protein